MQVTDLRSEDAGQEFHADLCIVGSGPAGLTIARELADCGLHILILESGGLNWEPESESLSEIESIGAPRIIEQTRVRNRIFGGSSHTWTGRCAAFDEMDFAARPWVPHSGWPIARAEMDPYIARAAIHAGIGPDRRLGRAAKDPIDPALLETVSWQFSRGDAGASDFMRFGPRFLTAPQARVRVLLHATATHINTDEAGTRFESVEIATPDRRRLTVRSRTLVLCAGGIENARLLLCSNRTVRCGVGNWHDTVGRFLMDHPRGSLGEFDLKTAKAVRRRYAPYIAATPRGRRAFVDGLALSATMQSRDGLLNCAAWLDEGRAFDDPAEAAKRLVSGAGRRIPRDMWALLSQPQIAGSAIRDKFLLRRAILHKIDRLSLFCSVEQRPDPDSRITLAARTDRFGMPVARLDWRVNEQEKRSLATLGRLIAREFARTGLPAPALPDWIRTGRTDEAILADVAHPTGTTRMAHMPREGVVDQNCQVHGVDGLFIAGSSVFPTTGHANPTLMILALAVRLADWLKTRRFAGVTRGAWIPAAAVPCGAVTAGPECAD